MKKIVWLIVLMLGFTSSSSKSAELNVPGDYETIQAAIDAAVSGDTVEIEDGVYTGEGNRDIMFDGKALTVKSVNGPENCVIDCQGSPSSPHRAFIIEDEAIGLTTLQDLTIRNGYANNGGGIFVGVWTDLTIRGCVIEYNEASICGGGLYIDRTFSARSNLHIESCIIRNNTAEGSGGGIFCESRSLIHRCTISHNVSNRDNNCRYIRGGGGACISNAVTMTECVIENNQSNKMGGGISVKDYGSGGYVSGCLIQGNESNHGGGGIALDSDSRVYDCTISGNLAHGSGGGVYCDGVYLSDTMVHDCIITDNTARTKGGGVYLVIGTVTGCTIAGNFCREEGGGLYMEGEFWSTPALTDCQVVDNLAEGTAGGVYSEVCPSEFINNLVSGNHGSSAGGAYFSSSSDCSILNCTFVGNSGDNNSASVTCSGKIDPVAAADYQVTNCIFWNDTTEQLTQSLFGFVNADHCNIKGGFEGEGNIAEYPMFCLGPRGYHYLRQTAAGQVLTSPCVGAGSGPASSICFTSSDGPVCLSDRTTSFNRAVDQNVVDMGYHYPINQSDDIWIEINMPGTHFTSGDLFNCSVDVVNESDEDLVNCPLYVMLDVYGTILFAPGFSLEPMHFLDTVSTFPIGRTNVPVVADFFWPDNAGEATGIQWYAALLNADMTEIIGEMGVGVFSWS